MTITLIVLSGPSEEYIDFQITSTAMAGEAQWIECRPANQRVASLIPSQGTRLACGPGSWLGGV